MCGGESSKGERQTRQSLAPPGWFGWGKGVGLQPPGVGSQSWQQSLHDGGTCVGIVVSLHHPLGSPMWMSKHCPRQPLSLGKGVEPPAAASLGGVSAESPLPPAAWCFAVGVK